jgi:hypothetical protein
MPARKAKDWIKSYLEFTAASEAPTKFHFWTAISTIAGALRRRVWIDQMYFHWVTNCYIILVAPPGIATKSTTAAIGMKMLKEIPGITFGPSAITWQKLVEDMGKCKELVYWPEKELYLPMSCLSISSGEFGNLLNPQDRDMVDILVALWDGQTGTFDKATKTSGNDSIENPWLNIIACTTPAWIAGNFPEYMIGGGFTSRCIFIYADKKRQLVAYPADHVLHDFAKREADLIHDLEIISTLVGEFSISKEGKLWGEKWYEDHWKSKHEDLPAEQFGGYLSRKQTHIHKLAMILSASQSDELVLHRSTLEASAAMVEALEAEMPKVFDKIGRSPMTKALGDLVDICVAESPIEQQALFRKMARQITWQEFSQTITSAVNGGFVNLQNVSGKLMVFPGQGKAPPTVNSIMTGI